MRAAPRLRLSIPIAAGLIAIICLLIGAGSSAADSPTPPYLDPSYSSKLLALMQDQSAAWQDAEANADSDVKATLQEARVAAVKDSLPQPQDLRDLIVRSDTAESWRYVMEDRNTWQAYAVTMGTGLGTADPYSLPCSYGGTSPVATSWRYAPSGSVVLQTPSPPSQAYPMANFGAKVSDSPIWVLTFTGSPCTLFTAQLAWKTEKSWSGCRELVVKLVDGSYHRAMFNFGK